MEELDGVFRCALMGLHHGVVNAVAADHAAHRDHAVGDALGEVQHVGHDAVVVGTKVDTHAAKASDHLVKNQQDAVFVADLAQPFQVALRRQIPTSTASHRFNDHGGDVAGVVQRQNAVFKLQQDVLLPDRFLVVNVGVIHWVVNEAHVVNTRQQRRAVRLAVGRNPAHAHAAKTHAVVATLAADEDIAMAFAARAVVRQRDLE